MTTMTTPAMISNQAEQAAVTPSVMARLRYPLFLLVLVGLPALFLLSSILIVRSASFPAQAADPFLLNPDYAFDLHQANCGIVVYGDSTAVTGVDPLVLERATGLKTCNISQSQSVLEVAGPIALDAYLRNNQPPKYLIIQLAPETLSRNPNFFWPEGLTVLLRRRPLPVALVTMIQHPVESYNFAMWAVKAKYAALRRQSPDFSATEAVFLSHNGLLTLPKPPSSACSYKPPFAPPSQAWVNRLRNRYAVNGTKVLIDVSPIPDCAPDAQRIADSMNNITNNVLPLYPIHYFCDLDRHLTMEGAEHSSEQIAKQVLALEHTPPMQSRN